MENTMPSRDELLRDIEAAKLRLAFFDLREKTAAQAEASLGEDGGARQFVQARDPALFRIIDRETGKRTWKRTETAAVRVLKKTVLTAACAALMFVLSFGAAFALSQEVRVKVTQMLIEATKRYTSVMLAPAGAGTEVPEGWKGDYFPAYIPEGYILHQAAGVEGAAVAEYVNEKGERIMFDEHTGAVTSNIDTENAQVTYTTIHDQEAIVSYKNNFTIVVWAEDERLLGVYVDGDADFALQIARSFTKINK